MAGVMQGKKNTRRCSHYFPITNYQNYMEFCHINVTYKPQNIDFYPEIILAFTLFT